MATQQIPSPTSTVVDAQGRLTPPWFQFLARLIAAVNDGGGVAPADAAYLLGGADAGLPNGRVATSTATVTVDLGTAGQVKFHVAASYGDVTGPASSVDDRIATFDGVTGKVIQDSGYTVASVLADALAAAIAAIIPIDLASEVSGELPLTRVEGASAGSRLLGRGDSGAGDWQEIALGPGLAMTGTELDTAGAGGSAWSVLTDGDLTQPELIFAGGDAIMVETP